MSIAAEAILIVTEVVGVVLILASMLWFVLFRSRQQADYQTPAGQDATK